MIVVSLPMPEDTFQQKETATTAQSVTTIVTREAFVCVMGVTWLRCTPMWSQIADVCVAGVRGEIHHANGEKGLDVKASCLDGAEPIMRAVAESAAMLFLEMTQGEEHVEPAEGITSVWGSRYEGLEEAAHDTDLGVMVVWATFGGSARIPVLSIGDSDWMQPPLATGMEPLRDLLIQWRIENEPPVRVIRGVTLGPAGEA